MRRVVMGLCLIIISMPGCKDKDDVPSGVMSKDKMQIVLWDILQADGLTVQLKQKDPVLENAKLQKQVFDEDNTTREEFYKSYSWYEEHPVLMEVMLDSMISKQEAEKRKQNMALPLPQHINKLHGQNPFQRR
jgi:uncharacterized protein DUF4296